MAAERHVDVRRQDVDVDDVAGARHDGEEEMGSDPDALPCRHLYVRRRRPWRAAHKLRIAAALIVDVNSPPPPEAGYTHAHCVRRAQPYTAT